MASAQEHGMIQITKFNQGDKSRLLLKEQRTEILGYVAPASRTNPQEQDERLQFLEGSLAVDEKELLEIQFIADSDDTIESEESKLHIDCTIVDKTTGKETPTALNFENITGFKSGDTVDIACRSGEATRIAYYEVPSNQQIVLGRKDGRGKFYCYLGDDTA